ncbi:MAG TPA: hypothetical protein VIM70_06205 [Clostridium sp.]
MKKWIPKDTVYCYKLVDVITSYDENKPPQLVIKPCKWHKYIGKNTLSGEYGGREWTETVSVYRCEYLNYTDTEQSSLLWDMCKECGEHYGRGR